MKSYNCYILHEHSFGDIVVAMINAFLYAFMPGFSFNVSVAAQTLAISTFVPQRYRNQVKGLLGNYDGDPANDFIGPDGMLLSPNATERQIFHYASQCELKLI